MKEIMSKKYQKKHVVRITDGLGNQLFQYAFAYALYRRTGDDVLLDPLFWGTSLRKYQLDAFDIDIQNKMVSQSLDFVLGLGPRDARFFKDRYRQSLIKKNYELVEEKKIMSYDQEILSPSNDAYFIGFWQNPMYFDKYYEELKKQLILKSELSDAAKQYAKKISEKTSVSLHIRRTDYVRDVGDATIDLSFYKTALLEIQKTVGDYNLFVFSDDKNFVKENFDLHDYILIQDVPDIEEFELMRECDNHIIANSTFSWWAAYLASNKGGIVYAPCSSIWSSDFYYKEWNLINVSTGQEKLEKQKKDGQ